MILKLTNKSKNFYAHLGRIFGSREVQRVTGDRFYDDDEKIWYLYYQRGVPDTFVAVQDDRIKNVWTEKTEHLTTVLSEINKQNRIRESIVPVVFKDAYKKSGFKLMNNGYKNFIKIRGDKDE